MKRICFYFLSCFTFIVFSCSQHAKFENQNYLSLNKTLYDSIQLFVDFNINSNAKSHVYLLQFLEKRSDSLEYILTALSKIVQSEMHEEYIYFYNFDSSLLIVNSCIDFVCELDVFSNRLVNVDKSAFLDGTEEAIIYNPLTWKLTIVEDKILIDKGYGKREAEKNILIPKQRFIPPQ